MGIPCKTLPSFGDLANLGGMSRANAQYGFPLEGECRKQIYQEKNEAMEIAPKHNNSLKKPFHMQYRSILRCISLTLQANTELKSLKYQMNVNFFLKK